MADTDPSSTVTLRLALVCYGGVSLAIYMHGLTKELLKLVQASAAFEQPPPDGEREPPNPFVQGDSAAAYFEALSSIAAQGLHLRVVIDVITGTSAGGINGVCLARALVRNESLDALSTLWLDEGDIKKLLSHPPHLGWPPSLEDGEMALGAMRRVLGTDDHTGAPLDGDHFAQMVYDALRAMTPAQGGTTGSLVPTDQRLTLVVPTTDVHGFSTPIPDDAGHLAHTDSSHRQAFRFDYSPGGIDRFGDDDVPALAFAARATAGFPGAFPALSIGSFGNVVGVRDIGRISDRLVYGERFGVDALNAWYIDGGVLDNGPFDHAVSAIAAMPATGQTRRVLAYLEPDPGPGPRSKPREEPQPSWFDVVKAGMWTIPRHSTYTEALGRVTQMNRDIGDIAALVESLQDTVDTKLATFHLDVDSTYAAVVAAADQLREDARTASPITFQTYCQLRAESVATEFGGLLADALGYHPSSIRATLVPQVLSAWVRSRPEWSVPDSTALEGFLGPVDLPFRRRRVMLLLQAVNGLLADSSTTATTRTGLTTLKGVCWQLLGGIQKTAEDAVAGLTAEASKILGVGALGANYVTVDPDRFAADHSGQLETLFEHFKGAAAALKGSSEQLWTTFREATATWPEATRAVLASRYLGFPLWDLAVFPVIELTGLPQLSKIDVCRFSPLDATLLPPPTHDGEPTPKLQGTKFRHFGGFFERSWRENDYLWGRLDGVVLIMDLLATQAGLPGTAPLQARAVAGLDAVLADEQATLTSIEGLIGELRAALHPDGT